MRWAPLVLWISMGIAPAVTPLSGDRHILVVTASGGDYVAACGGTLAKYAREGYRVFVAQFGNEDKVSLGSAHARARLANLAETKDAAKALGISDLIFFDHKSGELGYTSSTEMRHQLFGLIRYIRPRILFIPDPYVHYQDDRDLHWVGKMAEDAWGYSGGAMFANDLERYGLPPYGAPEVFYYAVNRPYRPGEGGDGRARFAAVDIASALEQKLVAVELLKSRNRYYAATVRPRIAGWQGLQEDLQIAQLARAFYTELAETIGRKHGFRFGEEFNHVGEAADPVPPYALERAVKRP